jgi:DNA-binding CsgD family transcriptional regulator
MQAYTDAETARARHTADEPCCWQLAARACEAADLPWDEAYCRWREAQALSRDRSTRRAAVAALRRAYRPAMDLQAAPLLDDLRAIATGLHVAPDDPRPRVSEPRPALPGLTRREREILAHVVAGRTNNEIARAFVLSDKTISTHVSNMLARPARRTAGSWPNWPAGLPTGIESTGSSSLLSHCSNTPVGLEYSHAS